jgi:Cytochrome c554 and c-prime
VECNGFIVFTILPIMTVFRKYFRGYRLIIASLALIIFASTSMCNSMPNDSVASARDGSDHKESSSEVCQQCHASIFNSYALSAHYHTSSNVSGSLIDRLVITPDSVFFKPGLFVKVEKTGDGIFQTAHSNGSEAARHPMDIVVGSGRKGQTFLFWDSTSLYQLPLSYSIQYKRWINSPGYPADKVLFNREIPLKCFECHASYAEVNKQSGGFVKDKMDFGISCETCHGPGREHAAYHSGHPAEKKGQYIINASSMSSTVQLEACAVCHSGIREDKKAPFSFLPGDRLSNFFGNAASESEKTLDVHGNQYGLLMASKCFLHSLQMTCSSCHNVHKNERSDLKLFAERCLNCHQEIKHDLQIVADQNSMVNGCINCHMPLQASATIAFSTAEGGRSIADSVRTHLIKIYKITK